MITLTVLILLLIAAGIVISIVGAIGALLLPVAVVGLLIWVGTKLAKSGSKQLPLITSEIKKLGENLPQIPLVPGNLHQKNEATIFSRPKPQAEDTSHHAHGEHKPQMPTDVPHANDTRQAGRAEQPARHREYRHFDIDSHLSQESIERVMREYENDHVVGSYARDIAYVLDSANLQRSSLFPQIDDEFERGTISWDRFMSTATKALNAIMRNCALLANRVQTFDVREYDRMEQFYRTGGEMTNGKQDPARIERWSLLRETMTEMDGLRSANEGLLLELGKLSAELSKLSLSGSGDDGTAIAAEVSRLVEETKYYR